MGREKARRIFDKINKGNTDYLSYKDFLTEIHSLSTSSVNKKLEIFFDLASDSNKKELGYSEILFFANISLNNNFKFCAANSSKKDFIKDLALYFTKLIFQICSKNFNEKICYDFIKEKIKQKD